MSQKGGNLKIYPAHNGANQNATIKCKKNVIIWLGDSFGEENKNAGFILGLTRNETVISPRHCYPGL